MAVDGLKGNKPAHRPKVETAPPAPAAVPAAKTEAKKPGGPADALGTPVQSPKVETSGKQHNPEVAKGSASRVSGDWLSGGADSPAERFAAAMKKLCPNVDPELVGPPANTAVAKSGEASLIGLQDDFFDPKASYAQNVEKLKQEGIPGFGLLSKLERKHETQFADAVRRDPETYVAGAQALAKAELIPTYEVDAMKRMHEPYGTGKKPAHPEQRALRLGINHALHPTAVAVARLAFLQKLDELKNLPDGDPKKSVFVTNGGCAAGKGSMTEILKRINGDLPFGAVWDAAGEGDGRENKWILDACASRGIKALFGYGAADPISRYNDVLARSESSGRVVDVLTFTNSYVEGAKNMKAFLDSAEYKAAAAKGLASALVVEVGAFDVASMSYKDAHPVGGGDAGAQHIPGTPSPRQVFSAALDVLEKYTAKRAAEGKSNDEVLMGALVPVQKFAQMGALEKL
jgi:hypothetical protein